MGCAVAYRRCLLVVASIALAVGCRASAPKDSGLDKNDASDADTIDMDAQPSDGDDARSDEDAIDTDEETNPATVDLGLSGTLLHPSGTQFLNPGDLLDLEVTLTNASGHFAEEVRVTVACPEANAPATLQVGEQLGEVEPVVATDSLFEGTLHLNGQAPGVVPPSSALTLRGTVQLSATPQSAAGACTVSVGTSTYDNIPTNDVVALSYVFHLPQLTLRHSAPSVWLSAGSAPFIWTFEVENIGTDHARQAVLQLTLPSDTLGRAPTLRSITGSPGTNVWYNSSDAPPPFNPASPTIGGWTWSATIAPIRSLGLVFNLCTPSDSSCANGTLGSQHVATIALELIPRDWMGEFLAPSTYTGNAVLRAEAPAIIEPMPLPLSISFDEGDLAPLGTTPADLRIVSNTLQSLEPGFFELTFEVDNQGGEPALGTMVVVDSPLVALDLTFLSIPAGFGAYIYEYPQLVLDDEDPPLLSNVTLPSGLTASRIIFVPQPCEGCAPGVWPVDVSQSFAVTFGASNPAHLEIAAMVSATPSTRQAQAQQPWPGFVTHGIFDSAPANNTAFLIADGEP